MTDNVPAVQGAAGAPAIVAEMQIDKKDIVDVALAKIESQIRSEIKAGKAEIKRLERECASNERAQDRALGKIKSDVIEIGRVHFNSAFKAIGEKSMVSVEQQVYSYDNETDLPDIIMVRLSVCQRIVLEEKVNASPEQISLVKAKQALLKELAEAKAKTVEWRSKLSDMPIIERQMKARVVESQLSKTAEGQDLLQAMVAGDVSETIKQICG